MSDMTLADALEKVQEWIECAPGGTYYWPCPTVEALADGAS